MEHKEITIIIIIIIIVILLLIAAIFFIFFPSMSLSNGSTFPSGLVNITNKTGVLNCKYLIQMEKPKY